MAKDSPKIAPFMMAILMTFTTFVGGGSTIQSAEKMVKEAVPLSANETLHFAHPERLTYDITQQPDDIFRPALRLRAFKERFSDMSFKIFIGKDDDGELTSQKQIDSAVQKMSASYVNGSVEKTNAVHRLAHPFGIGGYCVFTDSDLVGIDKLRPGQFRHITIGLVKVADYVFTIRGYSNAKEGDDYGAILKVIEGLKIEKTGPGAKKGSEA